MDTLSWLLWVYLIVVAVRNTWPQKMGLKAALALYALLLCSVPMPLLALRRYGLFGWLLAICLYGMFRYRDTRPQNICMGILGFVLAVIMANVLAYIESAWFFAPVWENPWLELCAVAVQMALGHFLTFLSGKALKRALLHRKGLLQLEQAWYFIDAALLLFAIVFFFQTIVRVEADSIASLLYYNGMLLLGYFLVAFLGFLPISRAYLEKMQAGAKQRAFQDLQDYTRNLETMYNRIRSFKHDYINILTSLSGYIDNGDMEELKGFFEEKILPTRNLVTQGDYKLNQLGNIGVLEIKSLLSAKMIYAHEAGIDVTIDIPGHVPSFLMDTVDLARVLGIFLDNALEAALETEQPKAGLNVIQNPGTVAVIISNSFLEDGLDWHRMKQQGFTTKAGHQGIGLANAREILGSYDNVFWETTKKDGCFTQYIEIGNSSGRSVHILHRP